MITRLLRYSHLSKMRQSPAHYRWAIENDEETKALRLGRAVHSLLLGGAAVRIYDGRRAGKAWEAFEADNADKIILIASEAEQAYSMRHALKQNEQAMSLLNLAHREETILWQLGDRACRSTPDAFDHVHLTELKSPRSADPERFKRDAIWRGYHAQCSFYRRALQSIGYSPQIVSIVAVESTPPYPVTIFELTERALEQGERLWRLWYERLLVCEASNSWPAYSESVVEFDVDDANEQTIVIDGEEVDL